MFEQSCSGLFALFTRVNALGSRQRLCAEVSTTYDALLTPARCGVTSAFMSDKLQLLIQEKIEALTAEIADLARAQLLEEMSAYLSGSGPAPAPIVKATKSSGPKASKKRPAKKTTSGPRKYRKRRSGADIDKMGAQIQKHVAANPGQRAEQIKKALGIATKEWLRPIGKLIADKKVKTRGRLRATKYYPGK